MPPSSDRSALAAFVGEAGTVGTDEGITLDAARLVFPPRAAWVTVELERPAGVYAIEIECDTPAALRLEVVTRVGMLPLPVTRTGTRHTSRFAIDNPLVALRFMPIEAGAIAVRGFACRKVSPWRSVLPDWQIGPLRLPPRSAERFAPTAVPRPASWDERIAIAAEAVAVEGERFEVGEAGVLRLAFDPPLAPGRYRVAGAFYDETGGAALVEPRLLDPVTARSPLDTIRILRPVGGGARHAGTIRVERETAALLLRPREQRGSVRIADFSVRRIGPAGAAAAWLPLASRTVRAAVSEAMGRAVSAKPRSRAVSGAAVAGPRVSIVTATRDAPEHLARFLESLDRTQYAPRELILLDNATQDPAALALLEGAAARPGIRVIRDDRPFNFAALSNRGAALAGGEVLVFANNDLEFVDPDWLAALVAEATREEVGIAGARLLYPDGRVQHAGLVLAGEARVRHLERFLPGRAAGHGGRQRHTTTVSGVTGALMAVRRGLFEALGGFDAARYGVLYNDIDLCLKAHARGLSNRLVPAAMAVHHESVSIGQRPTDALFARGGPIWRWARAVEADRFRQDWAGYLDADPCYPKACDPLAADFTPRVGANV
ncbi:glycosyltransferase family 2 protein [Acuticoccus sp. M5D2P5]|uniref:glycosyltransferase family 2 protein n=1 Tax=Acuticoccus kalidii TaxID=2910977 RepID=UPI001F38440A|nr:glycosyltransferase family 2 protein [Acuticoccus kalidii]MCF3936652.1 glycosyltransferase family 2 protein [Acuticoccus kalidii]